jgi:hypothetical protein
MERGWARRAGSRTAGPNRCVGLDFAFHHGEHILRIVARPRNRPRSFRVDNSGRGCDVEIIIAGLVLFSALILSRRGDALLADFADGMRFTYQINKK